MLPHPVRCPAPTFTLLCLATCLVAFFDSASAQTRIVRDCTACEMAVTLAVEVGTLDDPGAIGSPAHVVRRRNGEWVVADNHRLGRLSVFSSDGRYLRGFGRHGQGPGEYQAPARIFALPGDSLAVLDWDVLRVSTVSPELEFVRSRNLGMHGYSIAFVGDRHVVAGIRTTPASAGLPLHLMSSTGSFIRSFGADPPVHDPSNLYPIRRAVSEAGNGSVWSAELIRYVIEKWDTAGTRLARLERRASWFPPQERFGFQADPERQPTPGLPFIHGEEGGRVWVVIHVADPDYRSAFGLGKDPFGRSGYVLQDLNRYFDSIIELIDGEEGSVVGRVRLDGYVRGFAGPGLVITTELRDPGYPVVQVWRLTPP